MTKTKLKTVYKIKWNNLIKIFLVILVAVIVVFLVLNIYKFLNDRSNTLEVIKNAQEKANITSIVDDEFTKSIAPDPKLSKFDSYWDYIKLGLIDIDMANLKKINSNTIGYIEIKSTNFSYPIVEYQDGFYKNHSFNKKENSMGWIYLSENSSLETLGTNTIIMGNKTFANVLMTNLKSLYKDEWKNDDDNFILKYYTNNYSTLWQIISVYKTKDKNYTATSFDSEDDIKKFITTSIDKSEIKFKAEARTSDKFLTLTTNSNGENIVVLAKLIKIREEK